MNEVNIYEKYSHEVQNIKNELKKLEEGKIAELTQDSTDGSIAMHAMMIRILMSDLLFKIQTSKDSIKDKSQNVKIHA